MKLELLVEPMKGFGGGFRQEWATAEGKQDGKAFEAGIDSGGGLGNPLLTFWIKREGEDKVYYTADIRPILRSFITAMLKKPHKPAKK